MERPLISLDYAIKYLLRNKGDYELISEFVSAVLEAGGYPRVRVISTLEAESNREETHLRRSVADLVVEDDEKHR